LEGIGGSSGGGGREPDTCLELKSIEKTGGVSSCGGGGRVDLSFDCNGADG